MTNTKIQPIDPIVISNVLLLGLVGLLLSFYIVQANMIAADKYRVKMLNEKLTVLNEARTSLAAEVTELDDPSELAEFARSKGMVQASGISYIFENGNVALQR